MTDIDIINRISDSYDCNNLKYLSSKSTLFIDTMVNKIIENSITLFNNRLIRLIQNYFNSKVLIPYIPNIPYISGPNSVSYHYIPSLYVYWD